MCSGAGWRRRRQGLAPYHFSPQPLSRMWSLEPLKPPNVILKKCSCHADSWTSVSPWLAGSERREAVPGSERGVRGGVQPLVLAAAPATEEEEEEVEEEEEEEEPQMLLERDWDAAAEKEEVEQEEEEEEVVVVEDEEEEVVVAAAVLEVVAAAAAAADKFEQAVSVEEVAAALGAASVVQDVSTRRVYTDGTPLLYDAAGLAALGPAPAQAPVQDPAPAPAPSMAPAPAAPAPAAAPAAAIHMRPTSRGVTEARLSRAQVRTAAAGLGGTPARPRLP